MELLASIAYGIWLARNKFCFEGKIIDAEITIAKALSTLCTYQKIKNSVDTMAVTSQPNMEEPIRWKPPRQGCYKINTDACQAGEFNWGIGAVARDVKRNILAGATWKVACGKEARLADSRVSNRSCDCGRGCGCCNCGYCCHYDAHYGYYSGKFYFQV